MGIDNIQILVEVDSTKSQFQLAQLARETALIDEHRHGLHPWGSMRRDCPICQRQ